MEGVLLDAKPLKGALHAVIAAKEGLEWKRIPVSYRLYMRPSPAYTADELVNGVDSDDVDAWIENWLKPPWYDGEVEIAVYSSRDPLLLKRIASIIEARGVGRRVNQYPGFLVEALWRLGVPPGMLIEVSDDGVRVLENLGDPLYQPHDLRIGGFEAYAWHGPVSAPWERVEYYRVECCGDYYKARDVYSALDWLEERKPHIVMARLEARWKIPEAINTWLWFDPSRNLVSPWGLLEWMRISWLPYHEVHGAAIGKVLTSAEAREAYERRYLIDPYTPKHEAFRSIRRLAEADMAGAARIPEPGLYWNIIQLDYSSLYPSLIHIHNISSETVNKPGCTSYKVVPGVGHRICMERPGLVSKVLGRLVKRRARIKASKPRDPRIKERSDAIKWILVSGFGYLGYRNSLFGSISAYECVTAYAREALAIAEEEAEKAGYKLIHSIIDSIFVQPVNPALSVEELMEGIRERVGVPLKLEAWYNWLYIPPTLRGPGAVNKYYGSLKGGGLKLKGILAVRRDTPPLIARTQYAVIKLLDGARDPQEFYGRLLKGFEVVDRVREALLEGRVPQHLLVIEKRIGESSRRNTPWRRAAMRGGEVVDRVKYIVTSRGPRQVWEGPFKDFDKHYYLNLLESMIRELPALEELYDT